MIHKCPYCRQTITPPPIPAMPPLQYAIYKIVASAGSEGLHKTIICEQILKESGKTINVARLRIHIHYLNRRTLCKINQRISASGHYGIYALKQLEENDSGAPA